MRLSLALALRNPSPARSRYESAQAGWNYGRHRGAHVTRFRFFFEISEITHSSSGERPHLYRPFLVSGGSLKRFSRNLGCFGEGEPVWAWPTSSLLHKSVKRKTSVEARRSQKCRLFTQKKNNEFLNCFTADSNLCLDLWRCKKFPQHFPHRKETCAPCMCLSHAPDSRRSPGAEPERVT